MRVFPPACGELIGHVAASQVATLDVEYARVNQSEPSSSPEGGGWPNTCLDVLAALNSLGDGTLPPELAARLDLSKVHICGHSAGGHLALWLAAVSRLPATSREPLAAAVGAVAGEAAAGVMRAGVSPGVGVLGVIAIAPVASLSDAAAQGLSDFHDAPIAFLWRTGSSAKAARAALSAACPTELWPNMPRIPLSQPPLRTLVIGGVKDVDVRLAHPERPAAHASVLMLRERRTH